MNTTEEIQPKNKVVRIFPADSIHNRIVKVQAFQELTTRRRPTKEEVVLQMLEAGLAEYEKSIKDFIN